MIGDDVEALSARPAKHGFVPPSIDNRTRIIFLVVARGHEGAKPRRLRVRRERVRR
jgi:hypothetical protein